MSTATSRRPARRTRPVPELQSGDHLTQAEFHRRYSEYPEDVKFELVGGVVYMASPLGLPHGAYHSDLGFALAHYQMHTEGLGAVTGATVVLGDDSELQPDLSMWIRSEYGGRMGLYKRHYLRGAPELVAEISHSTVAFDLHEKKADYERGGVAEYIVLCVEEQEILWFDFKSRAGSVKPDTRGVFKSRVFPGLWIDGPALLAHNGKRLLKTLEQGLASPEHAAFVQKLEAAKKRGK